MNNRFLATLVALVLGVALSSAAATAATYTVKFGAGYAAAGQMTATTAQQSIGAGSWYKLYPPSPKAESYIDVAAAFGTAFTIDQITSISYRTVNHATNPSGVDFFAVLYTQPYVGGFASWYGQRLNAEPYLANGYVAPSSLVWNTWATPAGTNQLTFNDSNHSGNQGFYNAPTLADLQAGAIDWSTLGTNPSAGSATGGAIDYGAQTVKFLSFQTGSGWTSFEGWLDDVTVSLSTGDTYVIDFEAATDPLYVDDNWAGSGLGAEIAPGLWFGYNAFATVQDAVNAAIPGGTVNVAAGTYTEQVVVSGKNLTIQGAGSASTTIVSPAVLATSFLSPSVNKPVVLCQNAADIRVIDLTVDGAGLGNLNSRFIGIGFWNAGGKVLDCDVLHVRNTPLDGSQHGVGLYAYNNTGGPYAIEVGGCTISDFQKNGAAFNGTGLTMNVHDCVVTGGGAMSTTAQNGIQFGYGAGGTLANNAISNIGYTGLSYSAAGVLLYQNSATTSTGGSVTNCQFGYGLTDGGADIVNPAISTSFVAGTGGVAAYGVSLYNTSASAPNAVTGPAGDLGHHPLASPLDEETGSLSRTGPMATNAAYTLNVTGGCMTGTDQAGSEGLEVYTLGGPVTATVTGVEISNFDYGIVNVGAGAAMNAHHNALVSNVTDGYYGDVASVNGATPNWWGAASGPGGAGPGTGDAVAGANVTFAPWLISGADANPGCGFAAATDNVIAAGPAPSCISNLNSCVTIPVTIAHTTSENIRGYSVTLQLSSNLELCSGTGSITEGTYLNSIGGTTFQVVDNGGKNYTVDGAILGLPCGQTAASGTLFDLQVKKVAPGPDGTGTITVGTVLARDCDNAPITVNAGAPLSITIDTGGPTAIANLAATQQKTLNDADGTTKIQLTFSAPVDAATVEVYRAPYGAYPEYDDAGGAPPAAPAYPPAGTWTLTGVTASGQSDETTTRDFWYYVAFTKDACGNVSAVSNRTNGTLNYHLGDVTNGTPGSGDNLVGTIDITLLGAHYGITLAPADPFNYLDVGPTTDFSVNARPTTDNKVGFEDLMMFAINFGTVSAPQDGPAFAGAYANALGVDDVPASGVGETFTVPVRMSGAGNVLGASLAFAYDAKVAEFVSAEAGGLLNSQGREGVVLSPSAGVVDFALLGEGSGVLGEGTLLNVTFRRIGAGDPAIALKGVTARDAANRPVALAGTTPVAPVVTQMSSPFPNPFRGNTSLRLALARDGQAKVAIYDLVGRRVRTLVEGLQPAGERMLVWDGRDDGGRAVPAGLYLVRFTADGVEQSRRVILTQ